MDTVLAISPRNLGLTMLDTFCPLCFWTLIRMKFHPPFDHGGGALWVYMQQIQEAQIGNHLQKNGCLPKEFSPFCSIKSRTDFPKHWSKFRYEHKSGVLLYGVPDEIFTLADGSQCVIDHKTATNKGAEDSFLPIYRSQPIGYADIAENGLGLGEVTKIGLFYWEIQRAEVIDAPADHYEKGKVWVPFFPKPLEIDVDFEFLDPLLKTAKKLWESDTPPRGRGGCRDCIKAKALFALGDMIDQTEQIKDRRISKVEMWRGGVGLVYLFPALSSAGASLTRPCSVSTSRLSNRTGAIHASGSRRKHHVFAHGKFAVR